MLPVAYASAEMVKTLHVTYLADFFFQGLERRGDLLFT